MDSGEEEVENSHYWVGEGEEMYGLSGHKNHASHCAFPISQYYFLKIFQWNNMTVLPTPTWDLLLTCGLWTPACTLCCTTLRTWNSIWNRISSKASLPCSFLCSPSLGLSWESKVSHTSLSQYEILKVLVNTFCEATWTVLYAAALSCCYYICLTFLTCFRYQSFRYLMQNNKGEGGQPSHQSFVFITRGAHPSFPWWSCNSVICWSSHLPLSSKRWDAKGEANVITNLPAIQQP